MRRCIGTEPAASNNLQKFVINCLDKLQTETQSLADCVVPDSRIISLCSFKPATCMQTCGSERGACKSVPRRAEIAAKWQEVQQPAQLFPGVHITK